MIRNAISVIAGYALWTVIFLGGGAGIRSARASVHDANGLTRDVMTLCMYLILSVVASLAAGWVACKVSRPTGLLCVWILAACLLATGIPVQLSAWNDLPVWYHLLFLILLVPATILGARLAAGSSASPSSRARAAAS